MYWTLGSDFDQSQGGLSWAPSLVNGVCDGIKSSEHRSCIRAHHNEQNSCPHRTHDELIKSSHCAQHYEHACPPKNNWEYQKWNSISSPRVLQVHRPSGDLRRSLVRLCARKCRQHARDPAGPKRCTVAGGKLRFRTRHQHYSSVVACSSLLPGLGVCGVAA